MSPRKKAGSRRRALDDVKIRYLNTDLDLRSAKDLTALSDFFKSHGAYCLHVTHGEDDLYYATLEADTTCREPEQSISALMSIVESLKGSEKLLWRSCTLREFNIGYDCGSEPWAFNHAISNPLLHRLATAGAALRLTLYPPGRTVRGKKPARRKK